MIFQKKFGNTTFFHYLCKSKPPVIGLLKRLVFNLYRKSRFGQIGVGTMQSCLCDVVYEPRE